MRKLSAINRYRNMCRESQIVVMQIALLCVCVTWFLTNGATSRIVRRNTVVEVRNGRSVEMRKEDLSFNVLPGQACKVEVVANEPMYQQVGLFKPEIFDCDYIAGSLRYDHGGSPFFNQDVIKMRAYVLLGNQTMQETLFLHISILDSRCDVIQVNRIPIAVPNLEKKSNPVTRDVVDFDYDRRHNSLCQVLIPQEGFPRFGRLVVPGNSSDITGVEYIAVGNIKEDCEDFVLMGLRYEHLYPPTPDIDYIPLHVVVTDRRSGSLLMEERHWLPVQVNGAFPNQPPKASFSNMYILEVDQFVITNLLPMTIAAVDGETSNEKLVFNITKPPAMGFITHLQDESKPIESFLQQDLQDLQIAYQPPNVSFTERQNFEVEFVVYDEYFAKSEPIRALFSVRVAYTNAPRVSWNMGLTMLEGQSRVIDKECLQVVDKDNLDQVRFTLAGGLRHGRLYIGERPGFSFGWSDVVNGLVSYKHDDTDTRKDFINFRITDRSHSVRFKLPITILPKDDAPPFLINNIVFEVQEGQTILIHRFMLEASDADSVADYVTFNITTPPRAGEVQKRRRWERAGWSVNKFQQSDLYKGLIYYKHLGNEEFQDSFEFVLTDTNQPTPNMSPVHRVEIKITPIDDLLPEPGPGNSLTLTVNETDVVYVTSQQLNYIDTEQGSSDVTFTITSDLYRLDGTGRDAGKLIFTDDMVMLMKDPSVSTLRMFTQNAINHNKVAYMPPIQDVGRLPIDVQFVFSISDHSGKNITGKTFAITVLPINNQAPTIQVTEICLNEGDTEIIAADLIQVQDEDTDPRSLRIVLSQLPVTGSIRRDNIPLRKDDSFTLNEVELFRISYVHNGSEIQHDAFKLTVTDGKQNNSVVMRVKVEPVDDEQPAISGTNSSLHVPEGGSTVLAASFLSATDVDTDDEKLIFEILNPPRLGSFMIDEEEVGSFLQRDITGGRVLYVHNGGEVGRSPLHDLATVMVSDRRGQPIDDREESVKTRDLHFTIIPVNSRPPRLVLGHRVFRCNEGESEVISSNYVMAEDEDTPVNNLVYLVDSPPSFGYIEDVTPLPGYESRSGVKTTSFTHEQLLNGYIRYKQAEHQGIEPTSDDFAIAVTDGQYKSASVPFLISITPSNDEAPIITVENVTCNEGYMKILSLDVQDLDMPKDEVMISVVRPPAHGMIMDEMEMLSRMRRSPLQSSVLSSGSSPLRELQFALGVPWFTDGGGFHCVTFEVAPWLHHLYKNYSTLSNAMHHMEPMTEFSLNRFQTSQVIPAYLHDGSENGADEFEMKITDGRHVSKKLLMVKVMPVNDEKPRVVINRGVTLELGESKVISGVVLHSVDDDNPSTELVYELHSIPRRGNLQLKADESNWINLDLADSFTENDVEMNRLRYKHASVLGSKGKDSFRFSVSDGEYISARKTFFIEIEHTKKSAVHVVTHPLHVNEGEMAFVTAEVVAASDGTRRPQEISFDVIRNPLFGRIEYVAFPDVPIEMFTQLDLLARSVVYVHTSKEDSPVDTFRVMASNGLKRKEAEISVLIASVDSELPTLITENIGSASDGDSPHLSLFRGASVAISGMILKIQDADSPKRNLKLILLSLPEHGTLSLNGINIISANAQISEVDLESSNFFYQHDGGDAQIDRFSFIVTDGVHTGYIYRGVMKQEATTFYFKIESLDETPPVLITNQTPTFIEPIGNGRSYGITIDRDALEADDGGTSDPNDITFTVATPPSYGVLALKTGENARSPSNRFTQLDLIQRNVVYVIPTRLNVTNDSFVFDVEDSWGNTLFAQRFTLSWSRVEMLAKKRKVCEGTGSIPIKVKRFGNLIGSSFIGVKVKRGTASPGVDFVASSAHQLQFDRGSLVKSWNMKIINDSIEERNEKLKILLHAPVNCVLEPKKSSTLVIILDRRHRTCQKKLKSARTPTRKKKIGKRKPHSLSDITGTSSPAAGRRIRYGKLPPGTTVSPQSFFRNKTVRIWRYHAISSVTTGEEYVERIGKINNPDPIVSRNPSVLRVASSLGGSRDLESVQDDPDVVERQSRPFSETLNVENTNVSAVVTVRGSNERVERGRRLPGAVLRKCVLANSGSLYYDTVTGILYRCNGAEWLRKKNRRTIPRTKAESPRTLCDENWKPYGKKCYLVGDTVTTWNAAQRTCREVFSANLVTVNDKKLLKWLRKLLKRRSFWIGLNRKVNPTLWEWVGGDGVVLTNWKRGFPSSTSARDCALMGSKGQWIDSLCNRGENLKYVCEISP